MEGKNHPIPQRIFLPKICRASKKARILFPDRISIARRWIPAIAGMTTLTAGILCKKHFAKAGRAGFTLLELLIAMTIVISALAMGTAFVKKKDSGIKKSLRGFVALNRQLDHQARLRRQTRRLVIQMKEKKHSWWVEKQQKNTPLTLNNQEDKSSAEAKNQSLPPDGFVMDTDFFDKPQQLPKGLVFDSVESSSGKEPVKKGKAYIYYFPEGRFSMTLLKLKGRRAYWSLLIDRIHGELTVFSGNKTLKDFEQ